MNVPSPQLKLDVDAQNSCNWKCCFGCCSHEKVNYPSPKQQDHVIEEETTVKTTHVYREHKPK